MKITPNKHYTRIAVYAFLVIAASILFGVALQNGSKLMSVGKSLVQFVQPVVYGFVFAFLLNPMLRLFDDRILPFLTRGKLRPVTKRSISLILTYITMFIIIGAFFRLVIPQLVLSFESLFDAVGSLPMVLNRYYNNILKWLADFQLLNEGTELAVVLKSVTDKVEETLMGIIESGYDYVRNMVPQLFSAGARFTTGIINLLLGIIISIYFLLDREKLFAQLKKICNAIFSDRTTTLLYETALEANRVFSGFIVGKIIDSAIIGVICFFGMLALRMDYAVLISVIIGVTNIIPYFGPFIGAIPGVLILLISDPVQALIFIIFILVLQQFDGNILGPKILGDSTGLSALWVVFAIMLFSGLFGILGMFIGVPLFAVIYTVVKRIIRYLLLRKGKSDNTRDYASPDNPLIK